MSNVKVDWDEAKRRRNLRKHGIDFIGCETVFEGDTLIVEDIRFSYDERRFVTIGLLENRVVAVVHTETGRIISIRKATNREQKTYFRYFAN